MSDPVGGQHPFHRPGNTNLRCRTHDTTAVQQLRVRAYIALSREYAIEVHDLNTKASILRRSLLPMSP